MSTTHHKNLLPILAIAAALLLLLAWALPGGSSPATADRIPKNPYSAADFRYSGGYLTCTGGTARLGIDVSSHQGKIDWSQVAGAGIQFAFIRIGYRGYSEGGMFPDERAVENIQGAQAAGIPVGVYYYSQAVDRAEALEEAQFCIEFLQDHSIQLPVVYDWEYVSAGARTGSVGRTTLTECAKVFCEAIEEAGFDAMIYFNPDLASTRLDLKELTDYGWWLSWYRDAMTYHYRVDFWQYTENGNVPGITGDVDIDLWFLYG